MFEKEAEEYQAANYNYGKTDGIADAFQDGAEFGYNKAKEEIQERLKADLITKLKEQIQYSTSPSCTKGMELFIRSIEEWELQEK